MRRKMIFLNVLYSSESILQMDERYAVRMKELLDSIQGWVSNLNDESFDKNVENYEDLLNFDCDSFIDMLYNSLQSDLETLKKPDVQKAFYKSYFNVCSRASNRVHREIGTNDDDIDVLLTNLEENYITISCEKDVDFNVKICISNLKGVIEASLYLAAIDIIKGAYILQLESEIEEE